MTALILSVQVALPVALIAWLTRRRPEGGRPRCAWLGQAKAVRTASASAIGRGAMPI